MLGANTVHLIGNLGQDPDRRVATSGMSVTKLRLAVNSKRKNRESREVTEVTDWFTVKAFGTLADTIADYLTKGSAVYVVGELRTEEWTDNATQQKRSTVVIVANDVRFLTPRPERAEAPPAQRPVHDPKAAAAADTDFQDDDIPF